jgi:hypothetical protein
MKNKIILLFTALAFFCSSFLFAGKSVAELFDSEKTGATFTAATWDVETSLEDHPLQLGLQSEEPAVLLYANDAKTEVGFVANNVSEFDELKYSITYSHETEFGTIDEMIQSTVDNSAHDNIVSHEWSPLGSRSSGGTMVYYTGIEKVDIGIELISGGTTQKIINDTLAL